MDKAFLEPLIGKPVELQFKSRFALKGTILGVSGDFITFKTDTKTSVLNIEGIQAIIPQ